MLSVSSNFTPCSFKSFAFPQSSTLPSAVHLIPLPEISSASETAILLSISLNASAMGCEENFSAEAASASALSPVALTTANEPSVNVPVLSTAATVESASASRQVEPLTSIPNFAHLPIPPKYESGTEMTSAQGQEITKKPSALYIHFE